MQTYEGMRHFADSWGLLFMTSVFVGVVLYVWLRPGGNQAAHDASQIPFKED